MPGADLPLDPPCSVAYLCALVMPVFSREQNASSATGKKRLCRKGVSRRVSEAGRSVDQIADLLAQATQDTRACLANVVGGRVELLGQGSRVTVLLNGVLVIDRAELPGVPARGRIGLQDHGDPVEFRNLFIKPIDCNVPP